MRHAFYVAGGSDSSGYISASERWLAGDLYAPVPLQLLPTLPAPAAASPLAYRASLITGADVPVYPLGLPVFFAAARAAGGPLAPFVVAPLSAALLTWCVWLLGRAAGGPLAGVVAAVLIASSPVTLLHTVDAMSDVPAAALWTLAWVLALGLHRSGDARGERLWGQGAATGAAVAGAVLMRPNLAPLAIIPALLLLWADRGPLSPPARWRWPAALLFAAVAAIGPAIVAWSQATLYGGWLTPGYVEWESFFRAAHVGPNLSLYPALLFTVHSPLAMAGIVAAVWRPSRVTGSALALLILNWVIYLPYLSFDDWPFLRFLLPGLAALFVLCGAATATAAHALARRQRWLAPLALLPAVLIVLSGAAERRFALNDWEAQTKVRLMGHYLREVLPHNAVVLSFTHSGAVRHYTGRPVVRLDLLAPNTLDDIVDRLRRQGYQPVFVLDELIEGGPFRALFAASRYGRLDWPARATFTTVTRILYLDAADRDRFVSGERWTTDALP